MNTKYYTSIEQSKKLLELGLSPESADMVSPDTEKLLPCWSLGALLELMPETIVLDKQLAFQNLRRVNSVWRVYYESDSSYREEDSLKLIEAVYSMICWLLVNKPRTY